MTWKILTQLVITIPKTKTYQKRVFTVIKEGDGINFFEIYQNYLQLRPNNLDHRKLFVGYRNGKCVAQRVGIHTIAAIPMKIATFLGLPDAKAYTGHCFRRTSATFLSNAGAGIPVLKRHHGWKSSTVAEKYIESSLPEKTKIARMIQGGETFVQVLEESKEGSSTSKESLLPQESVPAPSTSNFHVPQIVIQGNTNCPVNIVIHRQNAI